MLGTRSKHALSTGVYTEVHANMRPLSAKKQALRDCIFAYKGLNSLDIISTVYYCLERAMCKCVFCMSMFLVGSLSLFCSLVGTLLPILIEPLVFFYLGMYVISTCGIFNSFLFSADILAMQIQLYCPCIQCFDYICFVSFS